jgi:hypothetical protein
MNGIVVNIDLDQQSSDIPSDASLTVSQHNRNPRNLSLLVNRQSAVVQDGTPTEPFLGCCFGTVDVVVSESAPVAHHHDPVATQYHR